MSDVEENVENVENVEELSFLSVMVLVDKKLDGDEVEEVLEDDEVMDLVEAVPEPWYLVLGIKVPTLLTWLAAHSHLLRGFCSICLSLCYSVCSWWCTWWC